VIPHGHFGDLWERDRPDQATAEAWLGLSPTGLRIGIVGAPRTEKLVRVVLDAVAACRRTDVEVVCWSLGLADGPPSWEVPDDPRIAIAEVYRTVDPKVYATRLAACDVLALVFDPEGDMLATGAAADASASACPPCAPIGATWWRCSARPASPAGHTVASVAAAIDALTAEQLAGSAPRPRSVVRP